MKISGFASEKVLQHFYSEFKKSQQDEIKGALETEARQVVNDLRSKKQLTLWENKVKRNFQKGGIDFETKFRIFPLLGADGKEYIYVPDFSLKNYLRSGKKIVIEANEDLLEIDKPMYAAFMQHYGSRYHLIMIVTDNQLRSWNTAGETLFHEIWTIDDMEYLVNDLKKYKVLLEPKKPSTAKKEVSFTPSMSTSPPRKYTCIGCRREFITTDRSQIYCTICLSKVNPCK